MGRSIESWDGCDSEDMMEVRGVEERMICNRQRIKRKEEAKRQG
jgi:hypothetical protein